VGSGAVKVVFLTTDDRLYLPAFFERVLPALGAQTKGVYVVPPLYKNQSSVEAARRYASTFGWADAARLALRLGQAKLRGRSVASVCYAHGVRSRPTADVNASTFLDELRDVGPDVLVSVSCPQIFKKPLIELAPGGCLNVHGALLPLYRGVLPSFWMLANGETRGGVSIYFVNEAIDAGELCAQRSFPIDPRDTLDSYVRRSKGVAADMLVGVLRQIEDGTITRAPLDLDLGSYYSWPDPEAVGRFRAQGRSVW
jgi:folate-dependent phosphoribosylglycinamide formyltransferase PurN